MAWEDILKVSTLEAKLKQMVKDGDYSHSKMAWAYKRMCKAGKDHVSEGLNGINLGKDLMYGAIGYALDAHAYVRLDDESRISEFENESNQIYKLLQEGLEICKKAKQPKIDETKKPVGPPWNIGNAPSTPRPFSGPKPAWWPYDSFEEAARDYPEWAEQYDGWDDLIDHPTWKRSG